MKWLETRAAWSAPQRRVLVALLGVMLVYLVIRASLHREYVPDPQPIEPLRHHELADRIDPNTADATTLAALPVIGEKRAGMIVEYREAFLRDHPGDVAFKQIKDLMHIKGIGPATIEHLRPYLTFGGVDPPTEEH